MPTSGLRVLSLAKDGEAVLGEPAIVDAIKLHACLDGRAVNNTLATVIGDGGSDLDHGRLRVAWQKVRRNCGDADGLSSSALGDLLVAPIRLGNRFYREGSIDGFRSEPP